MIVGQGSGTCLKCLVLLQFGVCRINVCVSVGDSHIDMYSRCIRIYLQPEYSTIA